MRCKWWKAPVAFIFALQTLSLVAKSSAGVQIGTEHYDIYLERLDPTQVARIVEDAYVVLRTEIGVEPQHRLQLFIYDDQADFVHALERHAVKDALHDSVGAYSRASGAALVWAGYYGNSHRTGVAILHECVHQFHLSTVPRPESVQSNLYIEGLAEYFSQYERRGSAVILGRADLGTYDLILEATTRFQDRWNRSFQKMATTESERPCDGWAVVAYLREIHPEAFAAWRAVLDGGGDLQQAFQQHISPLGDQSGKFSAWMCRMEKDLPFSEIRGNWSFEQITGDSTGISDGLALSYALSKAPQDLRRVTVAVLEPSVWTGAGVIFNAEDAKNFSYAMVASDGRIECCEVRSNRPVNSMSTTANFVASPKVCVFTIDRKGDVTTISVDGSVVLSWSSKCDGRGFIVRSGCATFSVSKS